jgi:hypothetical protein
MPTMEKLFIYLFYSQMLNSEDGVPIKTVKSFLSKWVFCAFHTHFTFVPFHFPEFPRCSLAKIWWIGYFRMWTSSTLGMLYIWPICWPHMDMFSRLILNAPNLDIQQQEELNDLFKFIFYLIFLHLILTVICLLLADRWPCVNRQKWWDLLSLPDTLFLAIKLLGTREYRLW